MALSYMPSPCRISELLSQDIDSCSGVFVSSSGLQYVSGLRKVSFPPWILTMIFFITNVLRLFLNKYTYTECKSPKRGFGHWCQDPELVSSPISDPTSWMDLNPTLWVACLRDGLLGCALQLSLQPCLLLLLAGFPGWTPEHPLTASGAVDGPS